MRNPKESKQTSLPYIKVDFILDEISDIESRIGMIRFEMMEALLQGDMQRLFDAYEMAFDSIEIDKMEMSRLDRKRVLLYGEFKGMVELMGEYVMSQAAMNQVTDLCRPLVYDVIKALYKSDSSTYSELSESIGKSREPVREIVKILRMSPLPMVKVFKVGASQMFHIRLTRVGRLYYDCIINSKKTKECLQKRTVRNNYIYEENMLSDERIAKKKS